MEASVSTDPNQQRTLASVKGMAGWLKFIGIVSIIGGGLQALTIVGIVIAWLPIWMGILLLQAGSRARAYGESADTAGMAEFTGKLRTYFLIQGILTIVSLCFVLLSFLGMALGLFGTFSTIIPQLLQQYGYGG